MQSRTVKDSGKWKLKMGGLETLIISISEFPIKLQLMCLGDWIHTGKAGMLFKCVGLTKRDMLSLIFPNTQSPTKSFDRSSNFNFDNITMENPVLVPSVAKAFNSKPFDFTKNTKFITRPKQKTSSSNNKRKPTISGMHIFRARLFSE